MKKNSLTVIILTLAVGFLSSCMNDDAPTSTCPSSPDLSNIDEEQLKKDTVAIEAYLDENNIEATVHPSGLRYVIVEEGDGDSTTSICQNIVISYVGRLMSDGSLFDKTDPGEAVLLHLRSLILGWQIGIPLIKEGGTIHLYIPSQLAYGTRSTPGLIPANSNLMFTIDLISVQ